MSHPQFPPPVQASVGDSATLPPGPIYSHGVLTGQTFGEGTCHERLTMADWMCEDDGRPGIGVLALLADSVTGWAASTRLPATRTVVTAQLRIEVYRMPGLRERRLDARACVAHLGPDVAFVHADLITADGERIGSSSLRAAQVPNRNLDTIVDAGVERAGLPLRRGSIGEVLDGRVRAVSATVCVCDVRSARELANLGGQLHGGVVVMAAERAIVALLARSEDALTLRPLDVDVAYLRPLEADDSIVTVRAELASRSRRFVQVSAMVHRPDGRVAATVRATYARPT